MRESCCHFVKGSDTLDHARISRANQQMMRVEIEILN